MGITLSFVGGDLLRIVLVVQVQAWRWTWIANFLAIVLLPFIAHHLWSRGPQTRAVLFLLVASWLCITELYAVEISALTILLALATFRSKTVFPDRVQRMFFFGASALLGLALIYHIATTLLFAKAVPDETDAPELLKRIRELARSGLLPGVAFVLISVLVHQVASRVRVLGIAAICLFMLALLTPVAVRECGTRSYDEPAQQAFSPWRAQIPRGTEVLWFDSPVASWLLLQRPSYLSNQQESSALFSRPAAMEMKRRVDALMPFLLTEDDVAWTDQKLKPASPDTVVPLASLCAAAADLRFIVTGKNIAATPIAAAPSGVSETYRNLRLYRCDPPHG